MAYYHNLVTEQSWQELQKLRKTVEFVLIGGWATYLYTRVLKSKDIDIIVDFDQLPCLKQNYTLTKNDRLKKYEAVRDAVQIDIYLPHYSQLGLPVEAVKEKAVNLAGFGVAELHYLLALKLYTLSRRLRTPKGKKDFLDCLALLQLPAIKRDKLKEILSFYKLTEAWRVLLELLREYRQVSELRLNTHKFAKLKKELSKYIV